MATEDVPLFSQSPGRVLAAALAGGVAAGTLDVFLASLIYNAPFVVILRAIAAGVLGKPSFAGGTNAALLGLGLQWFISTAAALVYIVAAKRLGILFERPLYIGPLFGAGVFCVMRFVVVPLSNANPALPPPIPFAEDFAANMLFGLIIALVARAMLRERGA